MNEPVITWRLDANNHSRVASCVRCLQSTEHAGWVQWLLDCPPLGASLAHPQAASMLRAAWYRQAQGVFQVFGEAPICYSCLEREVRQWTTNDDLAEFIGCIGVFAPRVCAVACVVESAPHPTSKPVLMFYALNPMPVEAIHAAARQFESEVTS